MVPSETAVPGRARLALIALVVLALLFGLWGAWRVLAPAPGDARARLEASETARKALQSEHEALQQRVATLSRSDQISRDANRELQGTLAERDEEIAGLRADVAFYERLVGATAQRRGLSVHAITMQPQSDLAWHFQSTLTQNLNRGAVSSGRLTLSVEGSRAGRLQTLDWDALRQQEDAPGVEYSFKYFQQVKGDVFLPEGFEPVRVTVRLQPRSGAAVEQSFTWAQATGATPPEPA
ncbi:DUF6776 family protein [Novilysobacter arseniciresistens]|uniref:DUF6776 family protein n=1 Tax=Novilysobacter arseniciresistens TaxID=1385522 RepID=UPI00056984F9|nr:DUF6776 family protein [Lysobacter arseniciresistens]